MKCLNCAEEIEVEDMDLDFWSPADMERLVVQFECPFCESLMGTEVEWNDFVLWRRGGIDD